MNNNIEYLKYKRARMGWHHGQKVMAHLGKGSYKIPFVYYFETRELLLVDDVLIEVLDFLQIPYEIVETTRSIQYIKED